MHWIIFGVMFILAQSPARHKCTIGGVGGPAEHHQASAASGGGWSAIGGYGVLATPLLPNLEHRPTISPFIRHWEPATYDRSAIERDRAAAHERRRRRRRKRAATTASSTDDGSSIANTTTTTTTTTTHGDPQLRPISRTAAKTIASPPPAYLADGNAIDGDQLDAAAGPVEPIRLRFYAHDRQFNVVLHEDPASVFAPDIEIENTLGPLQFDMTRVYTGSLEDDPNSIVHGLLTVDHLFDGTITTATEEYYVEPAARYPAIAAGVAHSIVYKVSDVRHPQHHHHHHRQLGKAGSAGIDGGAAEPQHFCASERLRRRQKNEFKRRRKADENDGGDFGDVEEMENNQNLDGTHDDGNGRNVVSNNSDGGGTRLGDDGPGGARGGREKRWLPEEQQETRNPPLPLDLDVPYNDDFNVYSPPAKDVRTAGSFPAVKTPPIRKSVLVSDYNPNSDHNLRSTHTNRNIIKANYDPAHPATTSSSRPSHKTHVEIITKHGATKKPNIIGSNYNPDVLVTSNNFHHPHAGSGAQPHIRNDISMDSATPKSAYDRKTTCMLYLQADHTFFQKMGSEEASIEAITRHVQRANIIYKGTDFNGDGKPDNITFMIKRIKVHNTNALKDPLYRFPGNYGVEKFLELFSEEDYDAFCLAYMFTYRDFEMGTLGLAWTGDLKNAGGVCEKNGHYRGSLKSLNTGIVTLLNYGKHVPPAVSHVTLAHEIGHNFGSPHDPEQCTPGGEDGNYIMFARATSGDKRNNNKFSPCSLKAIEPVLNAKARSVKGCFTEPQRAICGNGVVEPGEQCDCGWEDDCIDTCCFPMSRHPEPDEKPCTLTPTASCSPSQGPCCTDTCVLRLGDKCRNDNGCRDPSFCDGFQPQCPASINKPNKTICNKEFVCYMGECTGSICLAYGLESCQCMASPSDPDTKACELCCKEPGEETECKSSFLWNEVPFDVPDMYAKPGTPCNDYNGYCDVFQKCREVDPSGPLATLRKLLLSEESIASFRKWMVANWYTVALVIIALIVLMVMMAKLLGRGTQAKKKSVTIIHSATTETVRLPDDNNGVIIHTAVRTKVPLKKKVRGERSSKTKPTTNSASAAAATAAALNHPDKAFKRHAVQPSNAAASKKKKRVSAAVVDEDQTMAAVLTPNAATANTTANDPTVNKSTKNQKKSKHKEIIDYSKQNNNHSNTFGKVQKWLLESPVTGAAQSSGGIETSSSSGGATAAPAEVAETEQAAKVRNIMMNKSQSTPERLAGQRSPNKKVPSVGNLNDKVKLQVVYKPPFKFSLKLSKNSAVKTKVIGPGGGNARMKQQRKQRGDGSDEAPPMAASSSRRAALLIRTLSAENKHHDNVDLLDPTSEPAYETLTPKRGDPAPVYENMLLKPAGATASNGVNAKEPANAQQPINSATFRISKSASSSSLSKRPQTTNNKMLTKHRGSSSNLHQIASARNSQTDLNHSSANDTPFGSSQNLIRSSTTNLTKHNRNSSGQDHHNDLSRSSTTNLSKHRRPATSSHSGSQSNLHRPPGHSGSNTNLYFDDSTAGSRSRRNSLAAKQVSPESTATKSTASRASGNSSAKVPSLRRGSVSNNIPRANLKSGSFNQHHPRHSSQHNHMRRSPGDQRPHTADCTDGPVMEFEWPRPAALSKDDPLPSDLEVMVSDVENLVPDH